MRQCHQTQAREMVDRGLVSCAGSRRCTFTTEGLSGARPFPRGARRRTRTRCSASARRASGSWATPKSRATSSSAARCSWSPRRARALHLSTAASSVPHGCDRGWSTRGGRKAEKLSLPYPPPPPNKKKKAWRPRPQVYWWHEKYRPRKPKYFNRVHTGYEWNKYNQTHYDHDNPPPKVVQGYKFNIFYPDLIDKSVVRAPPAKGF